MAAQQHRYLIITLLAVFVLAMPYTVMQAQSLSLFNIDPSNFPVMKANFYAFDAEGNQQTPSEAEMQITENGIARTISGISCPTPLPPKSISSTLVVDISGSMMSQSSGTIRMDLAKAAARSWVERLPPGANECAITSFDNANYLNQDFTTDRARLLSAIDALQPDGGTDYDVALLKPLAGGLVVSAKGRYSKVIVFLTDGRPAKDPDVASIVQEVNKQNCRIYCVTLGIAAPQSLKDISSQTGAQCFENITTEQQATDVYNEILQLSINAAPCQCVWNSTIPCSPETYAVALHWQSNTASGSYVPNAGLGSSLQCNPSFVSFGPRTPGAQYDTVINLKAVYSDVTVTGLNTLFGGTDFILLGKSFPFTIAKNGVEKITLRFMPRDSGQKYASFSFQTDGCPAFVSAAGGYWGKNFQGPKLQLSVPNGGETFVEGSDTLIRWTGVAPTDTMKVEYSIDGGDSWSVLSNEASGMQYLWRNVPQPKSTQCLVRVSQLPTRGNAITAQMVLKGHTSYVNTVSFSPDGARVVTAGQDHSAKIWDAYTGMLLMTLSDHAGTVNSAVFSPDGLKVVTASSDSSAKIWNSRSGELLTTLQGHTDIVTSAFFSPNGARVLTSSWDNTAKIWRADSGQLIVTLRGHSNSLKSAEFSPDGSKVVTASLDGTAKIWDS